jgi:hypothetical protein
MIGWLPNDIMIFWKLFCWDCLKMYLVLWQVMVSARQVHHTMKMCNNYLTQISGKVDWMMRANCIAYLATASNSDGFFPVGDTWWSMFMQSLPGLSKILWQDLSSCDKGLSWIPILSLFYPSGQQSQIIEQCSKNVNLTGRIIKPDRWWFQMFWHHRREVCQALK